MKRIAIIGSGISGMGLAHILARHAHVTLYEKGSTPGGHARTLTVDVDGVKVAVDTGFIVFNHATYPNLLGLFAQLGIATQKSDMSFSFSMEHEAFEWGGRNLNAVFAWRRNLFSPRFYRMFYDGARFFREAEAVVSREPDLTLADLIQRIGLSDMFRDRFILPMGAAIWSSSTTQMLDFPAASFVKFFRNHGLLSFSGQHQWYTVSGGSQEYVKRLLKPVQDIRLAAPVARVETHTQNPTVLTASGERESYDEVVIAAHADEALTMIDSPTDQQAAILGAFPYQSNMAYLHRDATLMPRRKACWSSWNYHANAHNHVAVTYWMNRLQGIDPARPLFVSLNPLKPIPAEKVLDAHEFRHPVFTAGAIAAQAGIERIQGHSNLWFCGAYQRYGFHEDGLWSAVQVAKRMGMPIPWL